MTYEIEKNVPLPRPRQSGAPKYPWESMDVGDSFYVAGATVTLLSASAASWSRRHGRERKFATRTVNGGVRVWRVK